MSLCRSRASRSSAHGYERFTSYLTALVLFILLSNLMGLIPGLKSPTANVVVPLGFALVTFVYYHYHGMRANGFGYIKQFLGPVWWLYPLLLPIEIISHFARILSLTVRLYANMFAGDLLTLAVLFADSDWDSAACSWDCTSAWPIVQAYVLCCWRRFIFRWRLRTSISTSYYSGLKPGLPSSPVAGCSLSAGCFTRSIA